tara:strand:+ start:123 stop:239 length:117 start_codon:yes stop_codon:yes gene_type:complete
MVVEEAEALVEPFPAEALQHTPMERAEEEEHTLNIEFE